MKIPPSFLCPALPYCEAIDLLVDLDLDMVHTVPAYHGCYAMSDDAIHPLFQLALWADVKMIMGECGYERRRPSTEPPPRMDTWVRVRDDE